MNRSAAAGSLVLLVLLSGCVTSSPRPYPADSAGERKGAVQVVSVDVPIELDLRIPTTGDSAARGALAGGVVGLAVALPVLLSCGVFAPSCPAAAAAFYGSLGAGAAAGAAGGLSAESIDSARRSLNAALSRDALHETLATQVREYARRVAGLPIVQHDGARPASFSGQPQYAAAHGTGVESVLELAMVNVALRRTGLLDVRYTIELRARARLIDVSDGSVRWDQVYYHLSDTRKLAEWAEDQMGPLRQALQGSIRALAGHIADETLLLSVSVPAPRDATNVPQGYSRFEAVDSLRPTLRWTAAPSTVRTTASPADAAKATYEVRLFEARELITFRPDWLLGPPVTSYPKSWIPGEQVLDRRGIAETQLQLEFPLKQCTNYYWTVRRWSNLQGRPVTSEWAGNYGWGFVAHVLRRPPEGMLSLSGLTNLPEYWYMRFSTRC